MSPQMKGEGEQIARGCVEIWIASGCLFAETPFCFGKESKENQALRESYMAVMFLRGLQQPRRTFVTDLVTDLCNPLLVRKCFSRYRPA